MHHSSFSSLLITALTPLKPTVSLHPSVCWQRYFSWILLFLLVGATCLVFLQWTPDVTEDNPRPTQISTSVKVAICILCPTSLYWLTSILWLTFSNWNFSFDELLHYWSTCGKTPQVDSSCFYTEYLTHQIFVHSTRTRHIINLSHHEVQYFPT